MTPLQLLLSWCLVLSGGYLVSGRTPDETSSLPYSPEEPLPVAPATTPVPVVNVSVLPDLQQEKLPKKCFHRSREACPKSLNRNRCKRLNATSQIVCCDVDQVSLLEGLQSVGVGVNSNITELHIQNATLDHLNITQSHFNHLVSLAVTDGRILKGVYAESGKHSGIQCLNLSNNALSSIEQRAIVRLGKLDTLDISYNNLTEIPNFGKHRTMNLDISGNNAMLCQSLFKAKNETDLQFINANITYCSFPKTFHWFNSTELLPLEQLESVYKAQNKHCMDNCTCEPRRLDLVAGKQPTFVFMVDCSGKQLIEMPTKVPESTIALNISNNNITTLKIDDNSYPNIRELYADNNQITSILSLEGTKFIDNFVYLSLRNNKLKTLPAYMLSNIFDRNPNSRIVHLGLNRLQCDCNTAKILKGWLLSRQKSVLDFDEIFCENSSEKVIHLDIAKMCQHQDNQDWKDYIYFIIVIEVLLLLCLVLKVSYDYWVFKTAGYLPWPASKMPKLPCDWLCE